MAEIMVNLIGQAGAGKTTIAEHLEREHGFTTFRPSDVIREYAKSQDIRLTARADYLEAHREMLEADPDVIIDAAKETAGDRICVDGMRVPAHVSALQFECGMRVAALICPIEVRFSRVFDARNMNNLRDESRIDTLESFAFDEMSDNAGTLPHEANTNAIMAMADLSMDTNRPWDEVVRDLDNRIVPYLLECAGK